MVNDFRTIYEAEGWMLTGTGGGCSALEYAVGDDAYYWLTEHEDAAAPTGIFQKALLGFYWDEGAEWRLFQFATVLDAFKFVRDHPEGPERVELYKYSIQYPQTITPGVGADDPANR